MARVNERLSKVNQLNADVLGVVGHDVRTAPRARPRPSGGALGHLGGGDRGRRSRCASTRRSEPRRRLSALIDDILAMANFDTGTIATRPVRADLREVITEALAGLHGAAQVEVQHRRLPGERHRPFHLRQMVANLVSNALRYGEPAGGGDRARGCRRRRRSRSRTPGAGVPEDFVPHLFDRFTRATHRDRRTAVGQRVRPLHREPAGRGERLPPHLLAGAAVRIALPARAPRVSSPG